MICIVKAIFAVQKFLMKDRTSIVWKVLCLNIYFVVYYPN